MPRCHNWRSGERAKVNPTFVAFSLLWLFSCFFFNSNAWECELASNACQNGVCVTYILIRVQLWFYWSSIIAYSHRLRQGQKPKISRVVFLKKRRTAYLRNISNVKIFRERLSWKRERQKEKKRDKHTHSRVSLLVLIVDDRMKRISNVCLAAVSCGQVGDFCWTEDPMLSIISTRGQKDLFLGERVAGWIVNWWSVCQAVPRPKVKCSCSIELDLWDTSRGDSVIQDCKRFRMTWSWTVCFLFLSNFVWNARS